MRRGRVALGAVVAAATLAACGGSGGGTDGAGGEAAGAVISVFNRLATADGERVVGGDPIRQGAVLSTDRAGAATFSVGKKLDDCQIRPDSAARVIPQPGVLLDYQRGWTLCRTAPGDTDRAELTAGDLRITMNDPVWAVGAVGQAVVTRVFRGFVEVAATTAPGRLVGPDSESTAPDGRNPAPAQPFDRAVLDALDRQGVERMEATLPAPNFGFPPSEGSAALTQIRRRGALRLGVDGARTAQAAAFIGAYFDFLSEHWGVRIDVVVSRRPAVDVAEGRVDVAVVRPPAGPAQVPFFDDEQETRWHMAVAGDEPALLAALRTFLLGALEIGEYGRRYLTAFGTLPSYEAVRPLVLPDGPMPATSSAPAGTTSVPSPTGSSSVTTSTASAPTSTAAPFTVEIVAGSATQPASSACPGTVTFAWSVRASGPGTISYNIPRSDGATGPGPSTLTFEGAGIKTVTDSWTLGEPYSGWEALEILAPRSLRSQLDFSFTCDAASPSSTQTTNATIAIPR